MFFPRRSYLYRKDRPNSLSTKRCYRYANTPRCYAEIRVKYLSFGGKEYTGSIKIHKYIIIYYF